MDTICIYDLPTTAPQRAVMALNTSSYLLVLCTRCILHSRAHVVHTLCVCSSCENPWNVKKLDDTNLDSFKFGTRKFGRHKSENWCSNQNHRLSRNLRTRYIHQVIIHNSIYIRGLSRK